MHEILERENTKVDGTRTRTNKIYVQRKKKNKEKERGDACVKTEETKVRTADTYIKISGNQEPADTY